MNLIIIHKVETCLDCYGNICVSFESAFGLWCNGTLLIYHPCCFVLVFPDHNITTFFFLLKPHTSVDLGRGLPVTGLFLVSMVLHTTVRAWYFNQYSISIQLSFLVNHKLCTVVSLFQCHVLYSWRVHC